MYGPQFVKDVIAMYNTPRDEPAYIVLGVDKHLDNTYTVIGVDPHIDDAELTNMFNGWIFPVPRFRYEPAAFDHVTIAIIIIPPNPGVGPCLPLNDLPRPQDAVLRQHQLYTRRNSQNATADPAEQKSIYEWFRSGIHGHRSTPNPTPHEAVWDDLLEELHGFGPQYYYGLVASPWDDGKDYLSSLGLVDWSFVIDFDSATDTQGLLSLCRLDLETRRSIHLLTLHDRIVVTSPLRATYWYCTRGLAGRNNTIPPQHTFIAWTKMYGLAVQDFVNKFAQQTSARPVVLVALWKAGQDIDCLASILQAASAALADSLRILIVTDEDSPTMRQKAEAFDARLFAIPIEQFCLGVNAQVRTRTPGSDDWRLPSSSGAEIAVPTKAWRWLSEELQIVHLNEGCRAPDTNQPGGGFLRGNEVTWYDLGLQYDVPRTVTTGALRKVRGQLDSGRAWRLNLFHAPGAGGTTVSRRLLWDLHGEFPCALLLEVAEPFQTCGRLSYLARITGRPVLLVVDAGAITDRDADALYEHIASAHIPVVLLQVIRHYGQRHKSGLYVDSRLDAVEAERFTVFLTREVPRREKALRRAAATQRTPFLMALTAFGRDFVALESYVSRRLEEITEAQKKCIVFLAIAHHYGQRSVPVQLFAGYLDLPERKPVILEELFPSAVRDILVETGPGHWRTVHPIVAEECIRQVLSPPATGADRRVWRYHLSTWCREFIVFCRGVRPSASSEGLDLANRVFVFRGNSELIGSERAGSSQFSVLIEDLPGPEGGVEILRALTEYFPDEAHLWAHLGRFCSLVMKEYEEATAAIDRSISIQPDDHVLHHMKGMNLRARLYDRVGGNASLDEVAALAAEASQSFGEARRLRPDDEHGYISEVQMALRVLDYCGQVTHETPILAAASGQCPQWIRECTDNVESLLAIVREGRRGEEASVYEEECRARLGAIYGDHGMALQRWNSMLERRGTYRPPIRRQIVWTYLARRKRDWSALTDGEVGRSIDLLEDNLKEDPNDERNFRLWLRAIRASDVPPRVETVIEKLGYWHALSDAVEPAYYLFVMYALKALDGSRLAGENVDRYLEECRGKTRYRRNRTRSFEWIGTGLGLKRLVHQDALGEWSGDLQFWSNRSSLQLVDGVVVRIQGPEAGEIEIGGGLRAFYVPGAGVSPQGRGGEPSCAVFFGVQL